MDRKEMAVFPCKKQYGYVFVVFFLNAIGVFMVFRIREVLLKRGEKTGTDAHTELYRMPYRIK